MTGIFFEMKYENLRSSLKKYMNKHRITSVYGIHKLVPDVSYYTIRNIVNGNTEGTRADTIKAIEQGLEVRIDQKGNFHEVAPDFPDVSFLDDGTPEDAKSIQEFRTAFASFTPEQKSVFVEMMQILGNAPSDERTRVLQSFHQIVDTVFEKHKVKK